MRQPAETYHADASAKALPFFSSFNLFFSFCTVKASWKGFLLHRRHQVHDMLCNALNRFVIPPSARKILQGYFA
jgi:hypothetical protein